MLREHEIVEKIHKAKVDSQAADEFISQYMGFIRAETAKFIGQIPVEGQDDELSIAMFAFYESILQYDSSRGNFIKYASRSIKNRLIDFYRKEKRNKETLSLNTTINEEDEELIENIEDKRNEIVERENREATQREIEEFGEQLKSFGLSFVEVAEHCPKQERTLKACQEVLRHAIEKPVLIDRLLESKKLPITDLAKGSNINKKTIERHRKYIMAIILAFSNGYEIIRGHLYQIAQKKEGERE
ncbi:sigma-70 family RNA polymerase sigma factor [Anaerosphaera multitolerans]|uniref:RNA polymerase sigma factor SigI n=1 Tax=Anaerosphaera multitolerans TaxID=2487351 RepID=A0A437S5P8_9FIRM|nr:sigma-70 family RNA polymerase sigma factor [Anaerosphaera multitolerans]RVU54341.1 sigma-70 family RNA polymerase sigma factor [Anaerosphaera multitolerans]